MKDMITRRVHKFNWKIAFILHKIRLQRIARRYITMESGSHNNLINNLGTEACTEQESIKA